MINCVMAITKHVIKMSLKLIATGNVGNVFGVEQELIEMSMLIRKKTSSNKRILQNIPLVYDRNDPEKLLPPVHHSSQSS